MAFILLYWPLQFCNGITLWWSTRVMACWWQYKCPLTFSMKCRHAKMQHFVINIHVSCRHCTIRILKKSVMSVTSGAFNHYSYVLKSFKEQRVRQQILCKEVTLLCLFYIFATRSVNNCVQQKGSKIERPVVNSMFDPCTIEVLNTQKYEENLTNDTHRAGNVTISF